MIDKLDIKGTRDTPEIVFDPEKNVFEISGNSLPEDTEKFFTPIFNWLEKYLKNPNKETIIHCKLEYFNSSSAKLFYQLFIEFARISELNNEIIIKWHFDSGDSLIEEKGLEFKSVLDIPFEMIEE